MASIETALLRERLNYDPATGIFTYRTGRHVGREVGTVSRKERPYIKISLWIDGRTVQFLAHRLAWQHYYGEEPALDIDHRDGNCSNNRIDNLRLADRNQQQWNYPRPKSNSSGFNGVRLCKKTGKWRADIRHMNKKQYLGYFHTREEASAVYERKARELFGEFFRESANDNARMSSAI